MERIKEKLLELPERRYIKTLEIIKMINERNALKKAVNAIESSFMGMITQEMAGEKPKYANETARKAELQTRLFLNKDFNNNSIELDKIENRIEEIKAEIELIKDTMEVYKVVI